jgi:hypothetical protein
LKKQIKNGSYRRVYGQPPRTWSAAAAPHQQRNFTGLIWQLDIQVAAEQGQQYLDKYELKANDAILAEEKHMPM